MSYTYVEQNQAQSLNVFEKTILNSKADKDLVKKESNRKGLVKTVGLWAQRSRQRKQLSQLESHLLEDLGLTREMVKKEVSKPFWK